MAAELLFALGLVAANGFFVVLGITLASLGSGAVGEPAFHDLPEPLLGDNATIAGFGLASAIAFLVITAPHASGRSPKV